MPETNINIPDYEEPPYNPTEALIKRSNERFGVFEEKGNKSSVGDFENWEADIDRFQERREAQKPKKTLKSGDQQIQ